MIEIVAIGLGAASLGTLPFFLGWSPVLAALGAALVWGWSSGHHPRLASVALVCDIAGFLVGLLVTLLFGVAYAIFPIIVSVLLFVVVGVLLAPSTPDMESVGQNR